MSTEPLKICNECKGPIVDTSRRRFCSVACMRAWHNNAKKPTAAAAPKESITSRPTCPFCHKPMSPQASTYGAYCSELCRHKAAEDNDEEVQQVKAAEKPVAAAPGQHKGICKKCNVFFTTKTLPVRMYCTDECRRQALKDGDFKPGNPHKPAVVVEAAPPTSTPPVPTTSPTLPRRSLGDVYVATKSKLRRGLVAVLQGALNKLTT